MSRERAPFDVIVIGAGFSGLAAALRLVAFGKRVAVLEAHHTPGGLNSYYFRRPGQAVYNAGLHTVTNFNASDPRWGRGFLCRSLGLKPEELDLRAPVQPAKLVMPTHTVEFTGDHAGFLRTLGGLFPGSEAQLANFARRIVERQTTEADWATPAEEMLGSWFNARELIDLLRLPVYLYGGYAEESICWQMFRTIYRSLMIDGFCSPPNIKTIIDLLVKKIQVGGGQIACRQRVGRILVDDGLVRGVVTDTGEEIAARHVISSIGEPETRRLVGEDTPDAVSTISAFETTLAFSCPLNDAGVNHSLFFVSDETAFRWQLPPLDPTLLRYFTVSASDAYAGLGHGPQHHLKIGTYVRGTDWLALDATGYARTKQAFETALLARLRALVPGLDESKVINRESCSPRTVRFYTNHAAGGIYGGVTKNFSGQLGLRNLTLCGNDRGGIGIIGAAISGVIAANIDVLIPASTSSPP